MAVFALSHLSHWIKHQKEIQKSAADLGKHLGMELEPYDADELLEAPVEQLNTPASDNLPEEEMEQTKLRTLTLMDCYK